MYTRPNWPETPEPVKLRDVTFLESSQIIPNQLHGVASDALVFHVEVNSGGTLSKCFRSESKVNPSEFKQETETMRAETKRQNSKRIWNNPRFSI
ncbi:unnamed protein product [Arabidopsis thaliana]|uniref:Uncharacterized protein n=1 Tax=Arabidopsis thaliana TaxID=3702 RepID=A0A5S9WTW8_ARATH|nr:unnamed protein product [Arabidopsis thaliana]VYS50868.1 unnamed protein product [Arabidopsis thaliana]